MFTLTHKFAYTLYGAGGCDENEVAQALRDELILVTHTRTHAHTHTHTHTLHARTHLSAVARTEQVPEVVGVHVVVDDLVVRAHDRAPRRVDRVRHLGDGHGPRPLVPARPPVEEEELAAAGAAAGSG